MRQKTVTEKYRAVLEGKMAKSEFVRQMRQQYPMHVTQFNGFDDSVQILKNRGLLFEAQAEKKAKVYDERPSLPYSDDAFQRGIRYELEAAGIEAHDAFNIKLDDFDKAKKKAEDNLMKDPMHYLNLISGESSKVDKHDKEVPVKRGEGKVDVFNGLKKANLRESLQEGNYEKLAKDLNTTPEKIKAAIEKLRAGEKDQIEKDATKKAFGEGEDDIPFKKIYQADFDELKEFLLNKTNASHDAHVLDGVFHELFESAENLVDEQPGTSEIDAIFTIADNMVENYEEEGKDEEAAIAQDVFNIIKPIAMASENKVDEASSGLEEVMVAALRKGFNEEQIVDAVNRIRDRKKGDGPDMDSIAQHTQFYNKEEVETNEASQEESVADYIIKHYTNPKTGKSLVDDEIVSDFFKTHPEWEQQADGTEEGMKDLLHNFDLYLDANYEGSSDVREKKGKDHDGDGDIDGDDYMAAKDKAIKKAMGKDVDEALDSLMAEDSKTMGKRELAPHYMAAAKAAGFDDDQAKRAFSLMSRFMDKRANGRRVKFINYGWAGYEDLYKNLVDILNKVDGGGWEVKDQGSWYGDGSGWQVLKTYPFDNASENDINEKPMDKEEQLKEAIKKIIKESLLKEAATAKLSDIGDKYGDYKGMQVVINDLENIVTDMESYFAKTRERVQNAMDKIGQVETPDGMKVGAFLAPAIETAFFKDLNPVRKLSQRDIKLPQVKIAKFDDLQREAEAGIEEEPKQTVFSPVNEKK